jgi:hypothetical protein
MIASFNVISTWPYIDPGLSQFVEELSDPGPQFVTRFDPLQTSGLHRGGEADRLYRRRQTQDFANRNRLTAGKRFVAKVRCRARQQNRNLVEARGS